MTTTDATVKISALSEAQRLARQRGADAVNRRRRRAAIDGLAPEVLAAGTFVGFMALACAEPGSAFAGVWRQLAKRGRGRSGDQ